MADTRTDVHHYYWDSKPQHSTSLNRFLKLLGFGFQQKGVIRQGRQGRRTGKLARRPGWTKGPRPYNKQVTKDGAGGDCGSNRDDGFWRRGKTGRRDGNVPSALSNFGEGPKKHGFANVCDNVKSKEVRKELLRMWPQVPRPWDANQYSVLGQGQARQIQTSAAREERRLKERF